MAVKQLLRTTSLLNDSQRPRSDLETRYRGLSFDTDPPCFHQNFTAINTELEKKPKNTHTDGGGSAAVGSLWP